MEVINIYEIDKSHNDLFDNQELPSVNSTEKLIEDIHKSAIISEVKNNKDIQDQFMEQARKTVGNELFSINQENISRKQKTTYDANQEACRIYGIDGSVPLWQVWLMKIGTNFWFLIYWILATVTIAPINVFFKGIKSFIKNNVIVFILAILCYLIIVLGIPLLVNLF